MLESSQAAPSSELAQIVLMIRKIRRKGRIRRETRHGVVRAWHQPHLLRGGGNGDPLLPIPGLTLGIDDLQPVRQALTPRYRVIAADAPGSGRSKPKPRRYPASYYHDDSRSFLALLRELRATPAHVVGFSDGGEYALVMAELEPATVRSIVTWGAVGKLAAPQFVEAFGQVVDNPIPPMKEYSEYLRGPTARRTPSSRYRVLQRLFRP